MNALSSSLNSTYVTLPVCCQCLKNYYPQKYGLLLFMYYVFKSRSTSRVYRYAGVPMLRGPTVH